MDLKTTVETMLVAYPTLYSQRIHCLDHLFGTIGGGYEWEHGELVLAYHDPKQELAFAQVLDGDHTPLPVVPRYDLATSAYRRQTVEDVAQSLRDDHERRKHERFTRFYPLSGYGYSAIQSVPNDVQRDWLLGGLEYLDALLATSCREQLVNREHARKIKADLLRRFEVNK